MALLVVLNDLSYPAATEQRPDAESGAKAVDHLVTTLRAVHKHRGDVALVSEEPLSDVLTRLAPSWRSDPRNRDQHNRLRAFRSRSPCSSILSGIDPATLEYTWRGQAAAGLGAAHLVEGLAVSLALDPEWDRSSVDIDRCRLVESDTGDAVMVEDVVEVAHACGPAHVDLHRDMLRTSGLRVVTGAQLWAARTDFFPDLRFLPRVQQQLVGLDVVWLVAAKGVLTDFQTAVITWRTSAMQRPVPTWPGKVTPEGQQREHLCRFDDPETGERDLFHWHARFTPGAGRMHFRWDAATEKVIVAHLGRKLGS
jgi:hypothetical protein